MANSIQIDAIAQLLIEKGIITKEEFFAKLKQMQSEYKTGEILNFLTFNKKLYINMKFFSGLQFVSFL